MFGIDDAIIGSIAGPLLGGLFGGEDSQTEAKREPWAPAQPYILDQLKSGKKLQDYYQQNPFNQQQQTSYQNLYGDLDNFRQNVAPGLMNFANNAMTSSYQRRPVGNPGDGAGYTRGQQQQPMQQPMHRLQQQPQQQPQGLLQSEPFSVPQRPNQSYGLIDFQAQNPFTNGAIPAEAAPPVSTAPAQQPLMDEDGRMWDASTGRYFFDGA